MRKRRPEHSLLAAGAAEKGHKCDVRCCVDRGSKPQPFRWGGPRRETKAGVGMGGQEVSGRERAGLRQLWLAFLLHLRDSGLR
jgi:hypothetical protein